MIYDSSSEVYVTDQRNKRLTIRKCAAQAPDTAAGDVIWPPTGISLLVVLRFGYRWWPGIVLGDLIGNAGTGAPLVDRRPSRAS